MAVSNLVQAGATTEEIADKIAVSVKLVKAYVAKARTSASESLVGMVVTNLIQIGASDEDIAGALAVSGDTVEGLISNLPLRINGEEEDSSAGRSKPQTPPVNTPVPSPIPTAAPTPSTTPPPTPTPPTPTPTPVITDPKLPYSSDSQGRRLLGIIGVILSPLLLVGHSHAMRKRKQRA